MFNNQVYNQLVFNGYSNKGQVSNIDGMVIFNNFSLSSNGFCVNDYDYDNLPNININSYSNPVTNGGSLLQRRYPTKVVTVRGTIRANSAEDLENKIDSFKLATSKIEGLLKIKKNGVFRVSKATVQGEALFDRKHFHIDFLPFQISFITHDPFFSLENNLSVSNFGITTDHTLGILYSGTAQSKARFYFVFTVATVTSIKITKGDEIITINETISDGDILYIDGENESTFVNGIEVESFGPYPTIDNGYNIFNLELDGTYQYNVTYLSKINYL